MNKKEQIILEEIKAFYLLNQELPSIRDLQKTFNFHSPNAIYYYIKKLEKDGYLIRNNKHKLILDQNYLTYKNLKKLKCLNSNDELSLLLDINKEYYAFKIDNNYFLNDFILKNDIAIIEKKKKIKNNDLILIKLNNEYKIMKYFYQDGFYLLKDKEQIILNRVNIIGKVIKIERNR